MGKIKSKSIKKAAGTLLKESDDFTDNFEKNKKMLSNLLPSKKIRNQLAGYLAKLKKKEKNLQINT